MIGFAYVLGLDIKRRRKGGHQTGSRIVYELAVGHHSKSGSRLPCLAAMEHSAVILKVVVKYMSWALKLLFKQWP